MNRNLIISAVAPAFLVFIPGLIILNWMETPEAKKKALKLERPQNVATAKVPTPPRSRVESDSGGFDPLPSGGFDPLSAPAADAPLTADDILNAPIENLLLADAGFDLSLEPSGRTAPESTLISGILSGPAAPGDAIVLAEVDTDTLLPSDYVGTAAPDAMAGMTMTEKVAGSANEPMSKKPDAPEAKAQTEEKMPDKDDGDEKKDDKEKQDADAEHERISVALIKPKGDAVTPHDEVIVRSRVKGPQRGFLLVRARQKNAPWWVQDEAVRNGAYFRGRAQFGNTKTLDGTRFKMVVAFTTDKDAVPEAGVFFDEIPLQYKLSQEFDVTLNKD